MRILVLTNLYPNPFEPERAPWNRDQFAALANNHDVRIISPIAFPTVFQNRYRRIIRPNSRQWVKRDGLFVIYPNYYYAPCLLRGWQGKFYARSIHHAFVSTAKSFRPHIVMASWAYPDGLAAVQLCHRYGLPCAIQVHGSDIHRLARYPSLRHATILALNQADGVITVSNHLASACKAWGAEPRNMRTVYLGVDRQLFRSGSQQASRKILQLPAAKPIVLFVGALLPIKGIDILLQACARLRNKDHCFACYIIGDGPWRSQVEKWISHYRLDEHVELVGSRPHAELPKWYQAASVLAVPSRSEGMPTVVREALACGTPVVATSVGGVAEYPAGEHFQLIELEDPVELANALRKFFTGNDALRQPCQLSTHQDSAGQLAEFLHEISFSAKHHAERSPDRRLSQGDPAATGNSSRFFRQTIRRSRWDPPHNA